MFFVFVYPDFDWCQTGSWTFWWFVEDGWGNWERILQVKKEAGIGENRCWKELDTGVS